MCPLQSPRDTNPYYYCTGEVPVLLKTKTRITVSLPGQIERLMRNERGRGNGIGVPIAPSLTSQPLAVCLNGKIILADSQLT